MSTNQVYITIILCVFFFSLFYWLFRYIFARFRPKDSTYKIIVVHSILICLIVSEKACYNERMGYCIVVPNPFFSCSCLNNIQKVMAHDRKKGL